MYIWICMGTYTWMQMLRKAKDVGGHWSWSYRWLWATLTWYWDSNSNPLEERHMHLTTEPFFQLLWGWEFGDSTGCGPVQLTSLHLQDKQGHQEEGPLETPIQDCSAHLLTPLSRGKVLMHLSPLSSHHWGSDWMNKCSPDHWQLQLSTLHTWELRITFIWLSCGYLHDR